MAAANASAAAVTPPSASASTSGIMDKASNDNTPISVTLLLDFDGTITQNDTIGILAELAIRRSPDPDCTRALWEGIVNDYISDHEAHVKGYVPRAEDRKWLSQEFAFLESLRPVEAASAERVEQSGLFKGLSDEDLREWGRVCVSIGNGKGLVGTLDYERAHVGLRRGFQPFVSKAVQKGWDLAVISVNWSEAFVEGAILGAMRIGKTPSDKGYDEYDEMSYRMAKQVNSIQSPEGTVVGPKDINGTRAPVMMTSRDKLEAMYRLVAMEKQRKQRDGSWTREAKHITIYVGDSTTDLQCLNEAHAGIIMADDENNKVVKAYERMGMKVQHASKWKKGGFDKIWARNYTEILESGFIEGIMESWR